MKVLLTGRTGFIGKNILPYFQNRHEIVAPSRQELDLLDAEAVLAYIGNGNFDVVFHSANPNPVKNAADRPDRMFEDSLRIFMNLFQAREFYGKMIYVGSGAEYDKRFDMDMIRENDIGKHLPADAYGLCKFIENTLSAKSANVYNMRLFACYGPYDHSTKFITHAIQCCLDGRPVTIRQNCWFDYMHVDDFARIADWFIRSTPEHHDYNICSGHRTTLESIAQIVCDQMGSSQGIEILSDGFNKSYTASNQRLLQDMGSYDFVPLEKGIAKQIDWQRRNQA